VQDVFDRAYYRHSPSADPRGPDIGVNRVLRGSSWCNDAQDCRSANRNYDTPGFRYFSIGFRLALSPE
jgi:formylglycine-generating enzyme required for sulfatase activity